MTSRIIEKAERDEHGRLICEREVAAAGGGTRTEEIDATALFAPGVRKTGDVDMLLIEAKQAERGDHGGNPAKPASAEVAKTAIERIEEAGLEPAWRVVDKGEFP